MGVLTWGPRSAGWLSGRYSQASDVTGRGGGRVETEPQKFDPSRPENAAKLTAVTELSKLAADAGLTLPHLAVGFVLSHPAVTSVIIGPRTMDQLESLLTGADTVLSADVLDRIDEIVPPGTDLNRADSYYVPPALSDPSLRRGRPAWPSRPKLA
jgi:aryl-alcohol dehydrogenase-like predicted oxidoreductase